GRLDLQRLEVAVRMRVRHPFGALERLELAELRDAAGRVDVVEDRLHPREALEPDDLLRQQGAVRAELGVPLRGDLAAALVEGHRSSRSRARGCRAGPARARSPRTGP